MFKKPIICSNLAMRFYKKHWTKEEVESCMKPRGKEYLKPGEILDAFPNDADPYYIPAVGTNMDIKKLLSLADGVVRTFNDFPHETDEQFLEHFNW